MYLNYWRLREEPFSNALDPRFLFMTPQHSEGVARLVYAVQQRKEGALLTGHYGSGKSLVRTVFLARLEKVGNFAVALVGNPLAEPEIMLQDIYFQLGGKRQSSGFEGGTFRHLSALLAERRAGGFHNLIVAEDAQLLTRRERLEQLRLLMNIVDTSGHALLTLIFIGQEDVAGLFEKSPGLLQRLSTRWHLAPMTREQTRDYVSHRLSIAGGNGWIIDDSATDALHSLSGGIARIINNICDMGLYLGMTDNAVRVDSGIIGRVAADLMHGSVQGQEVSG